MWEKCILVDGPLPSSVHLVDIDATHVIKSLRSTCSFPTVFCILKAMEVGKQKVVFSKKTNDGLSQLFSKKQRHKGVITHPQFSKMTFVASLAAIILLAHQ